MYEHLIFGRHWEFNSGEKTYYVFSRNVNRYTEINAKIWVLCISERGGREAFHQLHKGVFNPHTQKLGPEVSLCDL